MRKRRLVESRTKKHMVGRLLPSAVWNAISSKYVFFTHTSHVWARASLRYSEPATSYLLDDIGRNKISSLACLNLDRGPTAKTQVYKKTRKLREVAGITQRSRRGTQQQLAAVVLTRSINRYYLHTVGSSNKYRWIIRNVHLGADMEG